MKLTSEQRPGPAREQVLRLSGRREFQAEEGKGLWDVGLQHLRNGKEAEKGGD